MVPYPSIALKDGKVWEKGKDGGQDTVIAPRIQALSLTRFGGHKRLVSERCPSRRFKHAAKVTSRQVV